MPICGKSFFIFGSNYDDLCLPVNEFLIVMAQLCHMPLAEWSHESTIENKQDVGLSLEIGKSDRFSLKILKDEIRSRGV
jgi:hypothetical protein